MSAVLTVAGVDVSPRTLMDVTITAGRDDIDSQPDASVLSATIVDWRVAGRVGDPVVLADMHGRMFAGTVTDLSASMETAGHWQVRLAATGPLADLGRVLLGDEPWPEESDSERVARIIALAGAPGHVDVAVLGPAMLPRDVDRKDAAELARQTADDALGVLWEQPSDPDTPIRYLPARLRSWAPTAVAWQELPAVEWQAVNPGMTWATVDTGGGGSLPGDPGSLNLAAGEVVAWVTLTQGIGDLARCVRVVWGVEVSGGDRPQEIAGAGIPEISLTTELAAAGDAIAVADAVWRTRREPRWRLREVQILADALPSERVAEIRAALAIGARVTITGIDWDSPIGSTWQGYLEGWRHEIDEDGYAIWLRTSERALTEPADRWQDVAVGAVWSALPGDLSWSDASDMP